jgi:purine nucleosidase
MKLWIDTDPGVDDALALMMALTAPDIDVVGLGIVGGNVGLTACTSNALKLLDVLGRDVAVHLGAAEPLLPPQAYDAAHVHGRDGFGDVGYRPVDRVASTVHAANALIEASHRHAGELVLLTLGPLTNFALALRLDPMLPQRLKQWVCMGGAVTGHGNTEFVTSEFNIAFDAEAAAICFARGPVATLVDWECVERHGVPLEEFERWLNESTVAARFFRAISARTRTFYRRIGKDRFTPADALAATILLNPDSVTERALRPVSIEMRGGLTHGQSVVDWRRRGGRPDNADIVMLVDIDMHRAQLRRALGLG